MKTIYSPSFNQIVDNILEIEYNMLGMYVVSITQILNPQCRAKLDEFSSDHGRHINEIKSFYTIQAQVTEAQILTKKSLEKTKAAIGNIMESDIKILQTILENENNTYATYKKLTEDTHLPLVIDNIITDAYTDTQKHKCWIENYISQQKNKLNG